MNNLISINDAAENGIDRLRLPKWAMEDHIKIDVFNGKLGPWVHMYSPFNLECNGRDPVDVLIDNCDIDAKEWMSYTGPLPESNEYKTHKAYFDGALKR